MKIPGFAAAILGLLAMYIGLHYYNASFYSRNFGFNPRYSKFFFLALALFSVFFLFARRKFGGEFLEYVTIVSYAWMGSVLIFSLWFFISDVVSFFIKGPKAAAVPVFFLAISFLTIGKSFYNALKTPLVKKIEIPCENVKVPFSIIQLSDAHMDYPFRKRLFFRVLERALAEKPDFIAIDGDLVDPGFKMSEEEYSRLKALKIPMPGVLGNHEYYYGFEKSEEVYRKAGIKLLINSSAEIKGVNFIGLGDIRTENISKEEALKIFEKNYKPGVPNILLSHQPLFFPELSREGDFIMLSGHVHKAQIFPFHLFVYPFYRFFYGLYRENNSFLYVTSGEGTWGPPMRLLAEAEIPLIILKPIR